MDFLKGSSKTKSYKQNGKVYNAARALQESVMYSNQIREQEHDENRSKAISSMASQLSSTREFGRKKIISEKFQFRNSLRDKLFLEAVYDMFMGALILDEDFKETYSGNFYALCEDMVGNAFQSGKTSYKAIQENGSEIIKRVLQICEDTADKEASKKFDVKDAKSKKTMALSEKKTEEGKKEMKEKGLVTMSKETKGDFDDKKAVESATVAEAVKDKVVQVIRDEQESAQKEESTKQEIEDSTVEETNDIDSDGTDGAAVSESVSPRRIPNKMTEHSLFRSLQINIANKNLAESAQLSENGEPAELNMDLVLAESIAYYTLLETMYTTKIIDMNAKELRSFSKELMIKK